MGKRNGWKRINEWYYLARDGEVVGMVYHASVGIWCWESYVAPDSGDTQYLREAKAALVKSVSATLDKD
jgi:hypothetical protein